MIVNNNRHNVRFGLRLTPETVSLLSRKSPELLTPVEVKIRGKYVTMSAYEYIKLFIGEKKSDNFIRDITESQNLPGQYITTVSPIINGVAKKTKMSNPDNFANTLAHGIEILGVRISSLQKHFAALKRSEKAIILEVNRMLKWANQPSIRRKFENGDISPLLNFKTDFENFKAEIKSAPKRFKFKLVKSADDSGVALYVASDKYPNAGFVKRGNLFHSPSTTKKKRSIEYFESQTIAKYEQLGKAIKMLIKTLDGLNLNANLCPAVNIKLQIAMQEIQNAATTPVNHYDFKPVSIKLYTETIKNLAKYIKESGKKGIMVESINSKSKYSCKIASGQGYTDIITDSPIMFIDGLNKAYEYHFEKAEELANRIRTYQAKAGDIIKLSQTPKFLDKFGEISALTIARDSKFINELLHNQRASEQITPDILKKIIASTPDLKFEITARGIERYSSDKYPEAGYKNIIDIIGEYGSFDWNKIDEIAPSLLKSLKDESDAIAQAKSAKSFFDELSRKMATQTK